MDERKLFKDKETEKVWNRIFVRKWSKELQKRSWEEMTTLFAFANSLNKLKEVFGTDLELLRGKRKDQHSIRVTTNDEYVLFEKREKFMK